jgi:hypothetical protein
MSIIKEFKNSINNNSNLKNKEIDYIPSYKNTIDNYHNYVESVLKSLKTFPKIDFEEEIRNISNSIIKKNK